MLAICFSTAVVEKLLDKQCMSCMLSSTYLLVHLMQRCIQLQTQAGNHCLCFLCGAACICKHKKAVCKACWKPLFSYSAGLCLSTDSRATAADAFPPKKDGFPWQDD